ncbi:hypothetical protein YYC_03976 [Plasmodium yoelii 17X]|uniref:Bis(5'-adenosyl)-triphosphatase n=3 Tax=Plasmodium yoelii TaxID=5861 RepID=A0AAE9WNW1_PLAYO|nr:histidine triad protein, putative [Plasmodium yoelii]ETB58362.1 hypothetical protein YYC_03976 [Plasmodium yoelii 17X]WBY56015.1 histidine triad protein [Plasmodium yoelii yoelii]CDU16997.1 histidine triad protein, putative [Plasmodium yoelii]VTZ75368.1 histidine triad protein, putative [Plasmodium yoelii]|eukprot:XP_022813170.1 histidine triad protein, putative [Plasmodium yoelii]
MEKYKKILERILVNKNIPCKRYEFGSYEIDKREIFITTSHSYGFVNNKPLLPGHILLTTQKKKKKYNDLDMDEIIDIHLLSNFMCYVMGQLFNTDNFSIAIQDGEYAGQTVDQLHIHIIPRIKGDYKNNDNIYKDLNKIDWGYGRNIICNSCNSSIHVNLQNIHDDNFKLEEFNCSIRSMEEMEKEATMIKSFIDNIIL